MAERETHFIGLVTPPKRDAARATGRAEKQRATRPRNTVHGNGCAARCEHATKVSPNAHMQCTGEHENAESRYAAPNFEGDIMQTVEQQTKESPSCTCHLLAPAASPPPAVTVW